MIKEQIQKFGKFVGSMIIPNIGVFIAWGFITAIFTSTGWFPNEKIALLVDPVTTYLLPILIGVTGGKVTGGARGGVVAAISTIGVIVGSDMPVILGSIVIGPLSGVLIKRFDKFINEKVPSGFEMLVNNFSLAIIGIILSIVGLFIVGPLMSIITTIMNLGLEFIIRKGLLPLLAIFIEPIKILFLNNAINHGIIDVMAMSQVNEHGKSILYLLEANPGPGLGVILAYLVYSKGTIKQSASSAAIIQLFGGIHEIYFPYILLNPILLLAAIIGNCCSIIFFQVFNSGLVSTASPGSIFSILMLSHRGNVLINFLGVCLGALISFFISSIILKRKYIKDNEKRRNKDSMKVSELDIKNIKKIAFVCDVGMGSSAMGATKFRSRIKKFNFNIDIVNASINNIPDDADIIVTHTGLLSSIKGDFNKSKFIFIENFLEDENLDVLFDELYKINFIKDDKEKVKEENNRLLNEENILLGLESESKEEAIIRAGERLLENGYIDYDYIDSMIERENKISTYIGMGIAIPHGTEIGKSAVKKAGVTILQYPNGVEFQGQMAYIIIAIAAKENEHLEILSKIATALEAPNIIDEIRKIDNTSKMLEIFNI
ncbi:PTS mannitol transporter subunit IICBA [uncultured Clostridium sp.]|uniref:PTS mannitol transporter subunit IICBA n=2 Tax=uncultured Clostridium sp. TaxID=59620 RepID=UPI00272A8098|nr:PTS mannitol transporter subunit IICBA [uncultured Clostridium sp.]